MAKDSATSWIILFPVTLAVFLEQGMIKSFSVLLSDIKDQFSTDTWVVGSSISIIVGLGSVIGLAAEPLVRKCGARVGYMICGLVSSIGLIVCSYAPNSLTLLLGMCCIGFLILQDIIAIGIVPDYFDSYFNTAVAIYSCGTGFGITVMPILTQTCLDIYGWRGTCLLLSGICMHSVPFGALIKRSNNYENIRSEKSPTNLSSSYEISTDKDNSLRSHCRNMLKCVFSSPLFTNVPFIAQVLVPAFVCGFTSTGWLIYIVSYASSNGASLRQASVVSTCGGIGLTAVRIVLPLLQQCMTYKQLMYLASLLGTLSLAFTTQFDDFIQMSLMSGLFGISYGILGAELYIATKYVTSEADYLSGVMWIYVINGVAGISTGFFSGWFFDTTGSFTLSFALLAAVHVVAPVSLALEEIFLKVTPSSFTGPTQKDKPVPVILGRLLRKEPRASNSDFSKLIPRPE
ncbi:monocarboxylate transporter 12-like [Amphiura filiformis]|uniref:monocarboxylate transporter 12-like n=1 Tax=Amphiura filiformis TaxID=82378 RepID=UPI003B224C08